MHARVQRWGNSLALRLPKVAVEQLGVSEGDELVVSRVYRYRLIDLLDGVARKHVHREVSTGQRRGREAW